MADPTSTATSNALLARTARLRARVAGGALVLVILALVGFLSDGVPSTPPPEKNAALLGNIENISEPVGTKPVAKTSNDSVSSNAMLSVISKPLAGSQPPPLEQPIVDFFDDAAIRSDAGDRQSACRLGFDLALCSDLDGLREAEAAFSATSSSSGSTGLGMHIEHLSLLREQITRGETVCKGLSAEQINSGWKHLARAAELGDSDAAVFFVAQPPLSVTAFLENIDGWLFYRNNYVRMLHRAVTDGNAQALYYAQRLAFGLPPIAELVRSGREMPTDSLAGLTYSLVLTRIADGPNAAGFERNAARARALLTVEQIGAAHAAANRIYERSFKHGSTNIDFESGPTRDFDAKKCYDR